MKSQTEERLKTLLIWVIIAVPVMGIVLSGERKPSKPTEPADPYITAHGEVPGRHVMGGFIEHVARDPDSVVVDKCNHERTTRGYKMLCDFRAKNGFGGYNRESMWFIVDQGKAVYMGAKEPH